MTHPIDNATALTPELRAELMQSMKTAIKDALSEPPELPAAEALEEDVP